METFEKFRRYLGIPLPYSMALVVNVLGALWEWVMKYMSEPEVLRRELERRKAQFLEIDASDREDMCDRVIRKGRLLLEMRSMHGKYAWGNVLAELGVSRRTAGNYGALFLFSAEHAQIYERLRTLGPTKIYRLARVGAERLKHFTLDTPIPTKDGMIPLRRATCRQLESFLREAFPPQRRTRAEKLREAAKRISNLTATWPPDEPVPSDALEMAASAVRIATQTLAGRAVATVSVRKSAPRRREEPPDKPG